MDLVVEVDGLWPDGAGAAPLPDGRLRVVGLVPGDRARVRLGERRGRVVTGAVLVIERPSPDRRPPPCPHSATCGGCDLDALRPDARRAQLRDAVARALAPVGVPTPALETPPADHGHRSRIKLALSDAGLGFRASGSHDVAPIGSCRAARPEVDAAREALTGWAGEPEARAAWSDVEIRSDGVRVVLNLIRRPGVRADGTAPLPPWPDVAVDGRAVRGDPTLRPTVAGMTLYASPATFTQVHLEMNERLVAFVVDRVVDARPERILELYAGNGNFSLPIAARTRAPLITVERDGPAVADARRAAREAGLSIDIRAGDVDRFDPTRHAYDVVVLDPPRAGAGDLLVRLTRQRPRRIVYVCCNPAGLVAELRRIEGYRCVEARWFDLFPDTHHGELVVVLDRDRR